MAEKLILTTPVTGPSDTEFKITGIFFGIESPSIKVDIEYNTGKTDTFRMVVDSQTTIEQVKAALLFINEGKFKTVQNKSLHKWLLEQIATKLNKPGNVTGTPE